LVVSCPERTIVEANNTITTRVNFKLVCKMHFRSFTRVKERDIVAFNAMKAGTITLGQRAAAALAASSFELKEEAKHRQIQHLKHQGNSSLPPNGGNEDSGEPKL
jgi:hypothetical protein